MVDAWDTACFAFAALIMLFIILRLIKYCYDKIIRLVALRITNRSPPANHGPHQISTRIDLPPPPASHQPPSTHHVPSGPHQTHFRADSLFLIHELRFLNRYGGNLPDLVIYEPQFTSPVASCGPHQSVDASINITPAMHQSNLRNGIPSPLEESHEFVSRLPRNYGMVDIPSQVHTFRGPYRSNSFDATMTPPPTPTSHMMPSMSSERPKYPSISAFTLQVSSNETEKGAECTVCLASLQGRDAVVQMPLCSHLFHEKCIRKWLLCRPSCPLCRSPFYA